MSPREHEQVSTKPSEPKVVDSSASDQIDAVLGQHSIDQPQTSRQSADFEQETRNRSDTRMKNTLFGYEMPLDVISVAYASVVTIGGVMGYVKAKSAYSLAAGLIFGGILGFGAYQTSVNPRNYHLTLATSAVLGAFMGYRAFNSGKFMPAGLVASLSLLMVLRFSYRVIVDSGIIKNR